MADNIVTLEMTWTEVDEAMKDRPVALVPVGAVEAHGPHLPLNTDTVIATEMAKRGAAKLKESGVSALILPPVYFTVAEFGDSFAGTLSVPPETSVALLRDVAVALAKKFRAVCFVNIHLEPKHQECLKKASKALGLGGEIFHCSSSCGLRRPRPGGPRCAARAGLGHGKRGLRR